MERVNHTCDCFLEYQIKRGEQIKMSTIPNAIPDVPIMTDNKEVNTQLIAYFWILIGLTFASQLITFGVNWISGTINGVVFGILCLGAVNTLLIGGGVKLVQAQMYSVSDRYNKLVTENKQAKEYIAAHQKTEAEMNSKINQYEAELIQLRVENANLKNK
jgi:hypothetical protein